MSTRGWQNVDNVYEAVNQQRIRGSGPSTLNSGGRSILDPVLGRLGSRNESTLEPTLKYSPAVWRERLLKVELIEEDVSSLVLNFLVLHGFKDAAAVFVQEAGISMPETGMPLEVVDRRSSIPDLIRQNKPQEVVDVLREMGNGILEANPLLHFASSEKQQMSVRMCRLRQKQFVQLISEASSSPNVDEELQRAIDFSRNHLTPIAESAPEKLKPRLSEMLNQTISLLAFAPLPPRAEDEVPPLLPSGDFGTDRLSVLRNSMSALPTWQEVAMLADEAILRHYKLSRQSMLEMVSKNLLWTQKQLEVARISFPLTPDIGKISFELPASLKMVPKPDAVLSGGSGGLTEGGGLQPRGDDVGEVAARRPVRMPEVSAIQGGEGVTVDVPVLVPINGAGDEQGRRSGGEGNEPRGGGQEDNEQSEPPWPVEQTEDW